MREAAFATRSTGRASRHTFIQTRFGVGYKLDPLAKATAAEPSEN